jgi:hypothetical protein
MPKIKVVKAKIHYVTEEELKEALISAKSGSKESKELLGSMILKIVQKLSTSSNFGGYTYKDDFHSKAIEHILMYGLKNYNPNLISKNTGQLVKAFSYITDIARRAFIAVINEMKEEERELRDNIIPIEELALGMPKTHYNTIKDEPKVHHDILIELSQSENGELLSGSEKFKDMFSIIREFEGQRLKIIYPDTYKISLEEFERISELKFDYLNINKFEKEKYLPSFPKRAKLEKEILYEEWE